MKDQDRKRERFENQVVWASNGVFANHMGAHGVETESVTHQRLNPLSTALAGPGVQ
jgi:hypothetical protein